mmetsp:Transcript_18310/g.26968  ORF Transcript_18310/g.26968 Transcript_18310/m.26968 type:complete len:214 (-) Transcript_18310:1467-2108(-)
MPVSRFHFRFLWNNLDSYLLRMEQGFHSSSFSCYYDCKIVTLIVTYCSSVCDCVYRAIVIYCEWTNVNVIVIVPRDHDGGHVHAHVLVHADPFHGPSNNHPVRHVDHRQIVFFSDLDCCLYYHGLCLDHDLYSCRDHDLLLSSYPDLSDSMNRTLSDFVSMVDSVGGEEEIHLHRRYHDHYRILHGEVGVHNIQAMPCDDHHHVHYVLHLSDY